MSLIQVVKRVQLNRSNVCSLGTRRLGLKGRATGSFVRRADVPEKILKAAVAKQVTPEGNYNGELPEQPELISHWGLEWSEPQLYSHSTIWTVMILFFGSFAVMCYIFRKLSEERIRPAILRDLPNNLFLELGGDPEVAAEKGYNYEE
eukprot:TRINITY_DN26683_c0_g1_i1.p1 TRINITY_DN26683_c0_g1~~TRINITY_DN26683_c0_g1_i1.p1  ORF type:complete len:148 (-),score=17.18 TRINITY_DN26683_c0_g1_i1:489-932(-)